MRFVTQEEEPEIAEAACGRAKVGARPWQRFGSYGGREDEGPALCRVRVSSPELFAHEIGHALGFFHVENRATDDAP